MSGLDHRRKWQRHMERRITQLKRDLQESLSPFTRKELERKLVALEREAERHDRALQRAAG